MQSLTDIVRNPIKTKNWLYSLFFKLSQIFTKSRKSIGIVFESKISNASDLFRDDPGSGAPRSRAIRDISLGCGKSTVRTWKRSIHLPISPGTSFSSDVPSSTAKRIARKPWWTASMADRQLERNRVLASLGTCVTWNRAIIFPLWHEAALQPREDFLQPGA